jgi:four helix bundle protein
MKSEVRSPKSEAQDPEIAEDRGMWENLAFWSWGGEERGEMFLRECPSHTATEPPDLEERAARFGEAVVRFAKRIPRGPATDRLTDQLVGAGTSLGANYCEARDAVSRKDFRNRVGINRKESKETMFFLRMLAAAEPSLAAEARRLWREARELNRIFGAIWRK